MANVLRQFSAQVRDLIIKLHPSSEFWHGELEEMSGLKRRVAFLSRVCRLVWRGFRSNRCSLQASALTYYTLMSTVPLLALALSLAKVFGGEELARKMVTGKIAELGQRLASGASSGSEAAFSHDFVTKITLYANNTFDQISNLGFSTLGGIGLVALIWMAISMLSQVESSFNSIWNASPRKVWRKLADFLTIIIIVPFLALVSSTIPVISKIMRFTNQASMGFFSADGLAEVCREAIFGALIVATFTIILIFVPNTKVKFKAGLAGGVMTALLSMGWFHICMALQVGVVKYSKLFGGFATIPIVLAWTYVSWEILLLGSEVAFAVQHSATFFRDEGAQEAGARARWQLALAIVAEMARRMSCGAKPLDLQAFAHENKVSGRLASDVVNGLVDDNIVGRLVEDEDMCILLKSPEKLTVGEVFSSVVNRGPSPSLLGMSNLAPGIRKKFASMEAVLDREFAKTVDDFRKEL